jgi:transcriptional regulator with XRE-family HTH domain
LEEILFRKKYSETDINHFIRVRIKQARTEANETQEDLAKVLGKSRVAVSDIERGRVEIGATDLTYIAHHYRKPISYFYPPIVSVQGKLSAIEEELIIRFAGIPETQQYIALEYVKQQAELTRKAVDREHADEIATARSEARKKKRK